MTSFARSRVVIARVVIARVVIARARGVPSRQWDATGPRPRAPLRASARDRRSAGTRARRLRSPGARRTREGGREEGERARLLTRARGTLFDWNEYGDERRAIDGLTTSDDGRTGRTRRFGFGGYSGGVSLRDASASGEVSSEVLDEDVARALRRCAQKSSTSTKVKALRELEESLFDGDEDDGARGGGGRGNRSTRWRR